MIDIAVTQLIAQASKLPPAQVTPSTEVRPLTQTLPRTAYTLIDNPRKYSDDGVLGLRVATYQLDTFGNSLADVRRVMLSIAARADNTDPAARGLDGFTGTVDTTFIRRIYFGSEHTGTGAVDPGQTRAVARGTIDMMVVYRETVVQPNFTL